MKTGIIIPFYVYPGAQWQELAQMKTKNPSVPVMAIINPGSGPGKFQDRNYVSGVEILRSKGIIILGYVSTDYGSRPNEKVLGDVMAYRDWYNVDGIMFDQVSNLVGYESHYALLANETRRLCCRIIVGNPGTYVPPTYFDTMDMLCIYERAGLPSTEFLAHCNQGRAKSKFASISYNVERFEPFFRSEAKDQVGWVYFTDGDLPNPYHRLPSYIAKEFAVISSS